MVPTNNESTMAKTICNRLNKFKWINFSHEKGADEIADATRFNADIKRFNHIFNKVILPIKFTECSVYLIVTANGKKKIECIVN